MYFSVRITVLVLSSPLYAAYLLWFAKLQTTGWQEVRLQRAKKQVSLELKLRRCLFPQNSHTLDKVKLWLSLEFKLPAPERRTLHLFQRDRTASVPRAQLLKRPYTLPSVPHCTLPLPLSGHSSLAFCPHQSNGITQANVGKDTLTSNPKITVPFSCTDFLKH